MCKHFLIGFFVLSSTLATSQSSFQKILEPNLQDTLLVGHVVTPLSDQSSVYGMTILTLDQSISILQLRPSLLRLSDTGEVMWNKVYRNGQENFFPDNMDVIAMNNTTDVLALIVGSSFSTPDRKETFIVKIDERGNKIWDKRLDGFIGSNIAQKPNGQLQISLPVSSSNLQGIVTLDENGDFLWARQLNVDWINRIVALSDGSTILSCFATDDPTLRDIYNQIQRAILVKLDANGDLVWAKISEELYPLDIQEMPNGDLVVSGFSELDNMPRLARIATDGTPIWYKRLSYPLQSKVANLEITSNGEIIHYASNAELSYISNLDGSGEIRWTRGLQGSTDDEFGKPFTLMPDGRFMIAAFDSTQNTYITALDENGRLSTCLNPTFCSESEDLSLVLTNVSTPLQTVTVPITNSGGRLVDFSTRVFDYCNPTSEPIAFFTAPDSSCATTMVRVDSLPEDVFDRYQWIFEGATPNNANTLIPPPITYSQSGIFEIYLITELASCVDTFSQQIEILDFPEVNLGMDTVLCEVAEFTLDVTQKDEFEYLWEDGSTLPVRTITASGTYLVEVRNSYCVASDSINIQRLEEVLQGEPIQFNLDADTTLCLGSELLLEVILDKAITDWEWEDGNKNPKRIINNEGNYIVTALIDGCSFESSIQIIADDCKGAIYVPNIFSPNGDNTNDVFFPDFAEVEILSLKIFNRWGVLVFDSINEPWDGRWNATEAPVGSYAYTITYKDLASDRENSLMGWVTLVR